jgi:5-deoxy-glucuronate isomerase
MSRRRSVRIVAVTPRSAGWRYVGFAAHRLEAGDPFDFRQRRQVCVVVRSVVTVNAGRVARDRAAPAWSTTRRRTPVRPAGENVRVTSHTNAEIGVASAPGTAARPARLIEPATMKRFARGQGLNTRYVCDILPQTEPADRLLVVEVVTPSGHSSSYPPHKHDTDNLPVESSLEETYYHRLNPAQGFAFQRVYTDDRSLDESLAVEDHDVVMVPRGYHPVVVPYGYDSYYLNVMAGPLREWHFKNDPVHEWMLQK